MRLPDLDRLADAVPHARLLSNGSYTVLLTGAGTGFSVRGGTALTRWTADRSEDRHGVFFYLRDLDRGWVWSLGRQPVCTPADRYAVFYRDGVMSIARRDHGIEARMVVFVDPVSDLEIRRIEIRNRSRRLRRIELTSYAEVVLYPQAAYAAHPAFAKLFVEAEFDPARQALLATRRPRSPSDPRLWLVQALDGEGPLEIETDRTRFVGRGVDLVEPQGLRSGNSLSGTVGSVLDPVFVLRRVARLRPSTGVTFVSLLAAAETREEALAAIAGRSAPGAIDEILACAEQRERELRERLGLSVKEAELLQELAGSALYGLPAGASISNGKSANRSAIDPATAREYWRAKGLGAIDSMAAEALARTSTGGSGPRRKANRYRPAAAEAIESAARKARKRRAIAKSGEERLLFDNGHGGFTPDGGEYVIRLTDATGAGLPPLPWVNVIANEVGFGCLVSETGAGCSWSGNSRENRLTPWSNDPVSNPHGEALYVRDEDRRIFWSPLPGPARDGGSWEVRHGFGYSRWRHESHDLEQKVTVFVPRRDPVRVALVSLKNRGRKRRRVSVFSYQRLVLGELPAENAHSIVTKIDEGSRAILARNPRREGFADRVVLAAPVTPSGRAAAHFTADRAAFLGRNGSPARPAALTSSRTLDGRAGADLDPCAALQIEIPLPPGSEVECAFLLGEAGDSDEARSLIEKYRRPSALHDALDEVRRSWRETVSAVQVETPSPFLDLMANGWLLYQLLSCRLWGRTAFYQSSGAFGFRDQLQDSAALVYSRPDLTRAQILLHAARQFREGDVLHWWHPPEDCGTRTHCSDDLLWLPYLTAFYVQSTGDTAILDERVSFVESRPLEPGEDEAYLRPSISGEAADLYEHCCRALDRSRERGAHGLPLIGTGDWNDGMNRVGREGKGESIWLGFFLHAALGTFLPICERRGDFERARRFCEERAALEAALNDAGWDGRWYRRAYYDDGAVLGSASSDECRIDAVAQAWAVMSGVAPPERANQAMDAVERELVSAKEGLIRLLWPPFDRTPHDPGYIKGYLPGIRENGGQYTHAALWVVRALAELGRHDRAAELLEMLTPVLHARSPEDVAVYKLEPYVVAADVYGAAPHVGRGGWSWYTGSAAWMYRVFLESILGFTLEEGRSLRLRPRVPHDWPRFRMTYRLWDGETRYEILVDNPRKASGDVSAVEVDGAPGTIDDGAARVSLVMDGALHHVKITLSGA